MGRIEWLKPTDSQKIKLNEAREQYEQKNAKGKAVYRGGEDGNTAS